MSEIKSKLSRRDFLEATTLGAAGLMLGSSSVPASALGSNDRVNVGVIGAGSQGSSLIRSLATVPNSRISGMCDIFEPNLNKGVNLAASQPKTFTDYRRLIESKDVDGVVIATPLHMHYEIALAALDVGNVPVMQDMPRLFDRIQTLT